MTQMTESDKQRICNGQLASVQISPEFFEEGDYTSWQDRSEETKDMNQDEYFEWLVNDMKKYDTIVIYSDGTIYGLVGDIQYDIDYNNFGRDIARFFEIVEKYGIQEKISITKIAIW